MYVFPLKSVMSPNLEHMFGQNLYFHYYNEILEELRITETFQGTFLLIQSHMLTNYLIVLKLRGLD